MGPQELLEKLARLLAGNQTDLLTAFANDAEISDGSKSLTPQRVQDHLEGLVGSSILRALKTTSSLTILVESLSTSWKRTGPRSLRTSPNREIAYDLGAAHR
jgi:hypothetical protein